MKDTPGKEKNRTMPMVETPRAAAILKALVVGALVTVFLIFFNQMHKTGVVHLEKAQVREALGQWDDALKETLGKPRLMAQALTGHIAVTRDEDLAGGLPAFLAALKAESPRISFLDVGPGGVTRWVYPEKGNERRLGLNVLENANPLVRAEVAAALAARSPVLGHPRVLLGGTMGVVMRQSVSRDGKWWGLVTVGMDLGRELNGRSMVSVLPYNLDKALRLPGEPPFWGDASVFHRQPVIIPVALPGGGTWELAAVPASGWGVSLKDGLWIHHGTSALIVLLSAGGTYLLSNRGARLRRGVALGTAEIQALNERLGAELEARKRSEERFEAFMAHIPGVVFMRDPSGRYVFVNEGWVKDTGIAKEDALGMTPSELFSKQDARELAEEDAKVIGGEPIIWKDTAYPFQGVTSYWMCSNFPIRDDKGQTLFVGGFAFEITRERKALDALKESEARYRDLVENSEDIIITHDLDGIGISANPAVMRFLGLENEDQVVGKRLDQFLPPSLRHESLGYLETIKTTGRAEGLLRIQRPSGESRIAAYKNTLRTEGVERPLVRGMARDVTAQLRAEKALRASEQRYRLLFERNLVGIYRFTPEGRILECNESFARILGYDSPEDLLSAHRAGWANGTWRPNRPFLELMAREKAVTNLEIQARHRDGHTLYVLENATLVQGGEHGMSESVIEGTIIDITERKALEAQAIRAKEFETAFKITQGLAHEVRNPLFAIQVNLAAWEKKATSGAEADQHVRYVLEHIQRLDALMRSLMELGRSLEEEELAMADPGRLLDEAWDLARSECPGRQIGLAVARPDAPLALRVAPSRVVRALMHLLSNAIEVSPDDGEVSAALMQDGGDCVITVTDHGPGIPPEIADRLFEPFATTHAGKPGLGLALARQAIELHGGTLTVARSDPGPGTTFTVRLPLARPNG